QLAASVGVDRGPGGDRPAVVQLPHDGAAAHRPVGAVVPDAADQGTGLVELGGEVEVVEALHGRQVRGQAAAQLVLAAHRLQVGRHRLGVLVQGPFADRAGDRGVVGRALVPELGGEARHGVAVAGVVVVLLGGPGHPVVHGAVVGVARVLGQRPGVGAGGGVAAGGVELRQQGGQQLGVV